MATFFTQLFESIFTPGPTPSLLVATNVSFACLQAVLFALLIGTYSIHFVILSFLSAGLWWSINWFVTELNIARARQDEDEKQRSLNRVVAGDETETEAETLIDTQNTQSGSKEVEIVPLEQTKELKDRHSRLTESKSELSTEDEWERVSENEKDK